MILLLIGLLCFVAALRVAREGVEGARRDVSGGRAAAWMGLLALLVLLQLAAGRGALDGYRLTLLGFRLALPSDTPPGEELSIGGDHGSADLWIPGAGTRMAAKLRRNAAGEVRAVPEENANAVALVEDPGLLATGWRILGARPVNADDTVRVRGESGTLRLVARTVPDTVHLGQWSVGVPWVREHVIRAVGLPGPAEPAAPPGVRLPGVERGLLSQLRPRHPSVFQRTYPLADVLGTLDPALGAAFPALSSFFFYRDGALHLADLDSEVDVSGVDRPDPAPVPEGARLLVAGLPLRDYPEPDLTLPERYGVRPLRSFRLGTDGRWLDAGLTAPETRALDREALEELRLPGARDARGAPVYRIRLASARDAMARQAVVFDAAPRRFAVAGQAVLSLPPAPTTGGMEVLTPAGLARWETGRPLALGTGDRQLLVRVDGQGTSAGFWWVHLVLLALPVALLLARPTTGPVFALALAAAGLAAFRLVLSLSALAEPPHVTEAQQLGLWLLPYLPWAVVVAGELGRREDPAERSRGGWPRRGFHVGYALVLVGLAAILFPGSGVKAGALSLLALATAGAWWAVRSDVLDGTASAGRVVRGARSLLERRAWWLRGWSLGLGLLVFRALLELLGFREQVTVAGTRIGVSVLYTPVFVAALTLILARSAGELRRAGDSAELPGRVARTLLDVGAFLLLSLVGVSAWISDFGIALVLLPGAAAALALLGVRWAPGGRRGVLTVATLALPLVLFTLVQAAPPLLRLAWGGDLQAVDARLGEWHRNELLLLERGDPAGLAMIGQRRSEALAVTRETMRSYTRGNVFGKGFLRGRVSDAVAETATREHAVSALLASQFGLPGTLGLVLVLLALLPPALELLVAGRRAGAGDPGAWRAGDRDFAGTREEQPGDPGTRAGLGLGLGLGVLVVAAHLLPSPFNALLVALVALAAVGALAAPAFGWTGAWGAGPGGDGRDRAEEPPPTRGTAPPEPPRASSSDRSADRTGASAQAAGPIHFGRLLSACALLGMALAGLYMVLANYGLLFFTGKNVYLLGLDSLGDALEATALLGMAALALGAERAARDPDPEASRSPGAVLEPDGPAGRLPAETGRSEWDGATGGVS